jgi:anti-sigma B factor antagonist
MQLHEFTEDGIEVLQLSGEIDLHYAPVLRTLLKGKARNRCPALVVEMSRVEFIDSSGLAALIEYLRDAAEFGGQFCIAGVTGPVRHIFDVVQLEQFLPIFADLGMARSAFGNRRVVPAEPLFNPETRRVPTTVAA